MAALLPDPANRPCNGAPPVLPSPARPETSRKAWECLQAPTPLAASLTSLEADETSVGPVFRASHLQDPDESARLCLNFRHSGWVARRERTYHALCSCDLAPASLARFENCGSVSWVMQSKEERPRLRLACNRCRSRWCIPCATEKRNTITANVASALAGRKLRFMTLTLRSVAAPLKDQLDRLRLCFRKLRQSREIGPLLTGGLYFIELQLSPKERLWHPHLHILFEGHYVPQQLLKDTWHRITGDSYIVDVRLVGDSGKAAGYVAKYAGKPLPAGIVDDKERFVEAIKALHGARTFHVFGDWTNLHLSKPPAEGCEWEVLGPLSMFIRKSAEGDAVARALLARLRSSACIESLDIDEPDSS